MEDDKKPVAVTQVKVWLENLLPSKHLEDRKVLDCPQGRPSSPYPPCPGNNT